MEDTISEVRGAGVPVEEARDGLRKSLVHAMRWGHTLVIRMADSAADFVGSYCADDCFPTRLFDGATLPSGSEIARSGSAWAKVLRASDLESGRFFVPGHFRVCVTSVFDAGKFEQRLGDALPTRLAGCLYEGLTIVGEAALLALHTHESAPPHVHIR